jgi:hypothetical protein
LRKPGIVRPNTKRTRADAFYREAGGRSNRVLWNERLDVHWRREQLTRDIEKREMENKGFGRSPKYGHYPSGTR